MTTSAVAILNTVAPFSSATAKESLDVALIFGSYEQAPVLFFQGDGVFQLIDQQSPEGISVKNFLKTFSAFEFYDIEDVYVCQQSLQVRNLTPQFHLENTVVLPRNEFIAKLNAHNIIFKF